MSGFFIACTYITEAVLELLHYVYPSCKLTRTKGPGLKTGQNLIKCLDQCRLVAMS